MSDVLVLIGGESPAAPFVWAQVDGVGRLSRRGVAPQTPPPATPTARTVLVLPGADARLKTLDLPAKTQAQARAGAAALLGAGLSGGQTLHYAVGAPQGDASARLVAAISTERLSAWLERCRELGVEPGSVMLDCTLWPARPDGVVIAHTPGRMIVSAGPLGGFAIEPSLLAPLLTRWMQESQLQSRRVYVLAETASDTPKLENFEIVVEPLPDPVEVIARAAAAPPDYAPELRQGEFASAASEHKSFQLWRFAALLAVAVLVLQIVTSLISGWRDDQTARRTLAAAQARLEQARPDIGPVTNLRAQIRALSNVLDQSARHPVLVTSSPLSEALREHPAVRLDEVRHRLPARDVELVFSASGPAELEAFVSALGQRGLQAESRNTSPRDGRYVAEVEVTAP